MEHRGSFAPDLYRPAASKPIPKDVICSHRSSTRWVENGPAALGQRTRQVAVHSATTGRAIEVEGAGAVGLAAILEHGEKFAGLRVAVPLTGGNIDPRMFASVIMSELVRSGQSIRVDTGRYSGNLHGRGRSAFAVPPADAGKRDARPDGPILGGSCSPGRHRACIAGTVTAR